MSSLTVTWSASTHANPVHYYLQYRKVGSQLWIDSGLNGAPVTSQIITGLVDGTMYEFRHIAQNGPLWTEVSQPTQLRAPSTPPNAPTSLRVRQ